MVEKQEEISEEKIGHIEHYNPVNVKLIETTGALALAIIASMLLIALLRAQKQIQELLQQQSLDLEREN